GGALAARFAAGRPDSLTRLVLVDALGLSAFEPTPRFGLAMQRFLSQPTAGPYARFMDFCAFDLDLVREQWGQRWAPCAAYAVELASTPRVQAAMGDLIGQFAATPIRAGEPARIHVPTTLTWGRHDPATPVEIAEAVRARYGWPLHVIEDAGDDPPLAQPPAVLAALAPAVA